MQPMWDVSDRDTTSLGSHPCLAVGNLVKANDASYYVEYKYVGFETQCVSTSLLAVGA